MASFFHQDVRIILRIAPTKRFEFLGIFNTDKRDQLTKKRKADIHLASLSSPQSTFFWQYFNTSPLEALRYLDW